MPKFKANFPRIHSDAHKWALEQEDRRRRGVIHRDSVSLSCDQNRVEVHRSARSREKMTFIRHDGVCLL